MKKEILNPLDTYAQFSGKTVTPDVNPDYILPKMFMFRLQKIMDEYAGGVSTGFTTSQKLLEKGLELLALLKEDSVKLAAPDLHD